jgi:membrane fusion protein, heavy metal efflux system
MKLSFYLCWLAFAIIPSRTFAEATDANTVRLDEMGVKNLRIETAAAEEITFEETVFALGRIEAIPSKISGVSSRIPGRIVALEAHVGDTVTAEQQVARIESRQPGDPPPVIPLIAPMAGMVTRVNANLGDPITPDTALLEITDLSEVHAIARIPEHQTGRMNSGTKAHIKVAALPDKTFSGELLRFGISADKESGTIDAIFRITNTDGLLRSNMQAEFSIVLSQRTGVLSIPKVALQGDASNRFVYVKHFDLPYVFIKSPVQIGEMNDRYVEIISGLFPTDEVVTRGAYSLSFVGGGSISLKEVLDAAHGHEHAEDGSELTPEKRAEIEAAKGGNKDPSARGGVSPIWMYASCLLFILLLASFFGKSKTPNLEAH